MAKSSTATLATIELEAVGATKGYLKFKEVEPQENTVGMFYFSKAMFDGKTPERITVTVAVEV
mgnify:CR=1 FL=1